MKKYIVPAVCAAVGVALGFTGGFIFAKNKYKKAYEDKVEEEMLRILKENDKTPEAHETTKEEAEEIAKDFPKELWTEAFKKDQEKRKVAREIVRQEGYDWEEGFEDDPAESEHPRDDGPVYTKRIEEFEEDLKLYSEHSGLSQSELRQGGVNIIDAEDYYDRDNGEEINEIQWSPDYNELRNVDGEVLVPEITLGKDYADILQYAESMPASDIFIHDERLDRYYLLSLESPRHIK